MANHATEAPQVEQETVAAIAPVVAQAPARVIEPLGPLSAPLAGGLAFPVQRKAVVGHVADPAEIEAEQVAKSVVTALRRKLTAPAVQRTSTAHQCDASCGHMTVRRHGEEGHQCGAGCSHSMKVRRHEDHDHDGVIGAQGGEVNADIEASLKRNAGNGVAINGGLRPQLEQVMGADLSGIRLHSGSEAADLNRSMSAVAFTHGRDVYFRDGLPDTGTESGLHLLAHELTHTVQQGTAPQISRTADLEHDFEHEDEHEFGHPLDDQPMFTLAQPISQRGGADGGIHRHSAFEHYLLGQVEPSKLMQIPAMRKIRDKKTGQVEKGRDRKDARAARNLGANEGFDAETVKHVINQEMDRLEAYMTNAEAYNGRAKEMGTVTQNEDGTWQVPIVVLNCEDGQVVATYAEMNTMPDLFGNPEAIGKTKKESLLAILQGVRQQSYVQLGALREELFGESTNNLGVAGINDEGEYFETPDDFVGAVGPRSLKPGMLDENDVNNVTKQEGNETEEYFAALERNACHFAPESWSQWKGYHTRARVVAAESGVAKQQAAQLRKQGNSVVADSFDKRAKDLANEAMILNSFGEHYLQDSFAAGHLIDKTKVMQWYTLWLEENDEAVGYSKAAEGQWNMAVYAAGNDLKSNAQALHDKGVRNELTSFDDTAKQMGMGSNRPEITAMMKWRAAAAKDKKKTTVTIAEFAAQFKYAGPESRVILQSLVDQGFANFDDGSAWHQKKNTDDPTKFKYTLKETIIKSLGEGGAYKATTGKGDDKTGALSDAEATEAAGEFDLAAYNAMLSNLYIQNATKLFHDTFCKEGLPVKSAEGFELGRIYGDDNMLNAGGQKGVKYSAETSQMSRNAVFNLINGKEPGSSISQIEGRFPKQVGVPKQDGSLDYVSVETWNKDFVKALGTTGGLFKKSMDKKSYWGYKIMGSLSSKGALDTSILGGEAPKHDSGPF